MTQSPNRPGARTRLVLLAATAILVIAAPAAAREAQGGFKTDQPSMIEPVATGVEVDPLINVGETVDGYMFESIPDGIALKWGEGGTVDAYVNHELSTVPFPATLSDFTNSLLSHLVLEPPGGGILSGEYVIPSSANYQRFCSNFLAGPEHGFDRPLLFTNEESSDLVNRTGDAWPPGPNAEQAGVVVAFDPATEEYRSIYGMGRANHENSVAVPGYGHPVVLTDDDTFAAPSAQLYMYTAADADAVWNDQGTLWAFRSAEPAVNDYGDLDPGDSVGGEFIPVPRDVAIADQAALETWSNANNVFQFIRTEDIAYDRNKPNVVYIADTGEPRALPDPTTGRLMRGPSGTIGPWPNGRIFKLVLNKKNPLKVKSLSILIDGDRFGVKKPASMPVIHNPDNVETTETSLLFTEDPGSHNQYTAGEPGATTARVWRYDLESGRLDVAARVDQSADPAASLGAWEASGIVDASEFFGPDWFLIDVQAHTIFVDTAPSPNPGVTYKREAGQLLLIKIPQS